MTDVRLGGCSGNFHVEMYIPDNDSVNENVVLVGKAEDVEKAKAYVIKSVQNAESKVQQDDDDWNKSGDGW